MPITRWPTEFGDRQGSVREARLVLDCGDPDALARFWSDTLHYRVSSSGGPYVVLVPTGWDGPELVLQRVPEEKTAQNRMHLDIRTEELDATVERLVLGTRPLESKMTEEDGFRWMVMVGPEGNEFCVCSEAGMHT
jgi:predicted enzyme related to lactoylglutathione lyase